MSAEADGVLELERPPYRLVLSRAPFTLRLYRGDALVLSTAPHGTPVRDWRAEGEGAEVTFAGETLRVRWEEAGELALEWETGEQPATMRFVMAAAWYGQGELTHQLWPLNRAMLRPVELLTNDSGTTGLKGIQTPAWLSADGVAVLARGPLEVAINQPPPDYVPPEGAEPAEPFMDRPPADPGGVGDGLLMLRGPRLRLEVLLARDLPGAQAALAARLGYPAGLPPAELFTYPIWSTWARYRTAIDQEKVLAYAREIVAHEFPLGIFEIDDRWQLRYGDLAFDGARFPDAAGLVAQLHALGFKVTAWVIPFLEPASQAYAEVAARGVLVQGVGGAPYPVKWWQGVGGLLDVTQPEAQAWFLGGLHALQAATGLDGFKFDAGEAGYVPADALLAAGGGVRNGYTTAYVDFVARHFALAEVRAGWFNQRAPLFFRQWDKSSLWGLNNGLQSVLTGMFTLGLTGYPFVLPDMVGGTAFEGVPDAELLVRWTELNAALPALQFSLAPWDYGEACAAVCRRYAQLHLELAPAMLRLAGAAVRSGAPLVRPVAWLAPRDERALRCDDEYLLGDELLAAPVVRPGVRARDVYVPPGAWRDYWTGAAYEGPRVLAGYPAPLEALPLFRRA